MSGGYYRTGDTASRDSEGYFWFVGRADDVFKSSDYRISPFEIESALLECACVAEAAVVPSPDPIRGFVPKGYVTLEPGFTPDAATARGIFETSRDARAVPARPQAGVRAGPPEDRLREDPPGPAPRSGSKPEREGTVRVHGGRRQAGVRRPSAVKFTTLN